MLGALREITGDEKDALKGWVGASVVKFLETVQASNFYPGLIQSHLLKFAKKESLDLIHRIVLSDHCSVNLRP